MARKPIPLKSYKDLEESFDFTLLDGIPPTGRDSVRWQCNRCGRIHHRSYSSLRRSRTICRCRTQTLTYEQYILAGAKHDLEPIFSDAPLNNKIPVPWRTKQGNILFRSYLSLTRSSE